MVKTHKANTKNSKKCISCGIRQTPRSGIILSRFPLDPNRCRLWVKMIGIQDLVHIPIEKLYKTRYVCDRHFRDDDFNRARSRLLKRAVPRLHLQVQPLADEVLNNFPLRINQEPAILFARKLVPVDKNKIKYNIRQEHSYYKDDDKVRGPRMSELTVSQRRCKYQKTNEKQQHIEDPVEQADLGDVQDDLGGIQDDLGDKQDDLGDKQDDLGDMQNDLGNTEEDIQSTSSEPEEPDIDVNMCRICVQSFSKLISLESYGLRTAYEQVTGVSVEHDGGLPRELCVECATLLDKYHRFRDKAIRGDLLLRQIYDKEYENQTFKPIEEIEESINSLVSTIDYSPEMTVIDVEPKEMIEQACQCDMEKEVIEQSMQDLEMSVVDDEEFNISMDDNNDLTRDIDGQMLESDDIDGQMLESDDIDGQMLESDDIDGQMLESDDIDGQILECDNLDQQTSAKDVTVLDSSDNEELNPLMADEAEVYIVNINRNKTLNNNSNEGIIFDIDISIKDGEDIILDDDISIKEEVDEFSDPLHSDQVTTAQDYNLININYVLKRLSYKEQVQQHGEKVNSLHYMSSEYKCQSCFQGFGSRKCNETHMELLHSSARRRKVCMICDVGCTTARDLKSHISLTHLYNYECKNCKKILFNRKSALRHITTHIGPILS